MTLSLRLATLGIAAAAAVLSATHVSAQVTTPAIVGELAWAYAITPPDRVAPAPVDDGTLHSLPGSDRQFTLDQIRARNRPADWYPGDHPNMPPIVAVAVTLQPMPERLLITPMQSNVSQWLPFDCAPFT